MVEVRRAQGSCPEVEVGNWDCTREYEDSFDEYALDTYPNGDNNSNQGMAVSAVLDEKASFVGHG